MPRPKSLIPKTRVEIQLHSDLVARMDLLLFSDVQGRVPYGAREEFIANLIREHFSRIDKKVGK